MVTLDVSPPEIDIITFKLNDARQIRFNVYIEDLDDAPIDTSGDTWEFKVWDPSNGPTLESTVLLLSTTAMSVTAVSNTTQIDLATTAVGSFTDEERHRSVYRLRSQTSDIVGACGKLLVSTSIGE